MLVLYCHLLSFGRRYAELGAHVALVARRCDQLDAVAAEALVRGAASALAVVRDFSAGDGDAQLAATLEEVLALEAFQGRLDVLVLNHATQGEPCKVKSKSRAGQKVQHEYSHSVRKSNRSRDIHDKPCLSLNAHTHTNAQY